MSKDRDTAFFGHPAGLSTLFFTEMWERLSYYGARAFLFVYMTTATELGGMGMKNSAAGLVMALYMSSVYLLSLPGGWIADRFLGQRRAVTFGGVGIMLGNVLLALPNQAAFYPGLAVIALGTGLLKPNISTIVGQLYRPNDIRRDAGYTIYYMGINIGAFCAPFVAMFIAQSAGFRDTLANHGIDPNMCWKIGFAVPALGMAFGIVQYLIGYNKMGEAGLHPTVPSDPKLAARDRTVLAVILGGLVGIIALGFGLDASGIVHLDGPTIGNIFGVGLLIAAVALFVGLFQTARTHDERKGITAMIPLFLGAIAFFAIFEQASTTLSDYAERFVHREVLGVTLSSGGYQFFNAAFIIILATPFAYMWTRLAKAGKEPSSVLKFSIGMVLAAVSFVVLIPSLGSITELDALQKAAPKEQIASVAPHLRVSGLYLVALYFVSTLSELFISPVGLSSMSKLAPTRLAGMVMGTWFLATAIGNYLAGRAAGFSESRGYTFLVYTLIISSLVIAGILFAVAPMIKKMMASRGDDHAHAPADHSEKAEPDPLPAARAIEEKSA
ncbi:MAG TPA: oligopeptide:H+ symporter [Kofleriaceae bacterium]|nr:oligopeptide:H+ symporter [Kofleriaceae bacterium]